MMTEFYKDLPYFELWDLRGILAKYFIIKIPPNDNVIYVFLPYHAAYEQTKPETPRKGKAFLVT